MHLSSFLGMLCWNLAFFPFFVYNKSNQKETRIFQVMKNIKITNMLCLLYLLTGCADTMPVQEPESTAETSITAITEETATDLPAESVITEEPTTQETIPPMPETVILKGKETLEVHQNITCKDFITNTNVMLQAEDVFIDTSQTGTFEVTVPYYYGTEIREEVLSYRVQDTTPPVILNDGTNAFIRTGETFDLRNLIGYGDNYDHAPSLTYDGDVDTAIAGNYMIIAYLTDNSGNQSSCRLTVTVADTEPDMQSSQQRMNFSDFVAEYSDSENAFGIDVSKWQGYIDYNAVKKAGCEFVLMRIGYSYGEPELDDYYLYNIDAAKEAGLKVGVYFYTTDTTEAQIRADADWIVEKLDGRTLDMPIAFDWEDFRNFQKYDITLHDLNLLWEAFADELKQNGCDAMLYGSKYFLEHVWESPDNATVWLAHYTQNTSYQGNYLLWQRTDAGIIDGIDVPVDFNILYKNQE